VANHDWVGDPEREEKPDIRATLIHYVLFLSFSFLLLLKNAILFSKIRAIKFFAKGNVNTAANI